MCIQNTTAATKTEKAATVRTCKWMCSHERTRELLCDGHRAPLQINVNGELSWYWIEPIQGGWRLHKESPAGEQQIEAIYDVDTSFGPEPARDWSCDCPAGTYRRKAQPKACKHVLALAAALKVVGVE